MTKFNGETAEFKVETEGGTAPLSYTWYYKNLRVSSSFSLSATTIDTYTIKADAEKHSQGFQVYCVVTDADGKQLTSDVATMTVGFDDSFKITAQPLDVTKFNGETAEFKVETEGGTAPLSYTWYYKNLRVSNSFSLSATTTDTYTIQADAEKHSRGFQVYCVVTDADGKQLTSDVATMTVGTNEVFQITAQPQSVTAAHGETAEFKVETEGGIAPLSYTWYYKNPITTGSVYKISTISTDTYTIKADKDNHSEGFYVYCVVKDAAGAEAKSDEAMLTVAAAPLTFKVQPQSAEKAHGETAVFLVETEGGKAPITYTWYAGNPDLAGEDVAFQNVTEPQLSVTADAIAHSQGLTVYCVAKDAEGTEAISDAAVLTVSPEFTVDELTYRILGGNKLAVIAYSGSSSALTIPDTVYGLTVTEIGERAFAGNTSLSSIDLPDTITVIHAYAFKGCTSLREMK